MKKNKLKAIRVGDVVRCVFLDHCEDGDDAIEFEVFGRVMKMTPTSIVLGSWIYTDPSENANTENQSNLKVWVIVRKAIKSIEVLEARDGYPI